MKAATSSLHDQLAETPGVFMSSPKELYFFSDDPVHARGIDWYGAHFSDAAPGDLCGESTTHYAKLPTYPNTVRRIAEAVPNARFIYVMRHPIERLISQYTHMWLEKEITASFSEAVDGAVPELIDYSRYSMQLLAFLEEFGADSVLPVFVDRLRVDPNGELQRIARHIGLEQPISWNDELAANNVSAERLQQSRLRDTLKRVPGYESARTLIPEKRIERVRDRWRPSEKPELSVAQQAALTTAFDADLALLGQWLGAKLTCDNFRQATAERPLSWTPTVSLQFPTSSAIA